MIIEIFSGFALFASAISLNKLVLAWLSPSFFVGIRRLTSGILLFGYESRTSLRFKLTYIRPDIIKLSAISLMTMCLPSILKAYGFKYLVSSKAALIGSLDPFVTALYAYILWGEVLNFKKIIGMITAFSGILFLLTTSSPIEVTLGEWWIISLPELAMFASMAISRLGWIMARQMLKAERYTPPELNSINMLMSGTFALILSYLFGTCNFCVIPPTLQFAALFSYAVVIGDILCYNIYGYFLKKYNIILLSLCGLSLPLFVHLLGPLLHHEPITIHFFVAFALVFAGTMVFYRDELKRPSLET